MNAKTFGERVRHYRIQRGWDQSDLATRVEKSVPTISRIENGTQQLRLEMVEALARALEVHTEMLLNESDGIEAYAAEGFNKTYREVMQASAESQIQFMRFLRALLADLERTFETQTEARTSLASFSTTGHVTDRSVAPPG